jgi:hypothetical protein
MGGAPAHARGLAAATANQTLHLGAAPYWNAEGTIVTTVHRAAVVPLPVKLQRRRLARQHVMPSSSLQRLRRQ